VLSLPLLRAKLEEQRRFRVEQLADLDTAADPANREVNKLLEAAARQALANIELALDRMATGHYGTCRHCGTDIPLDRLYVIPQSVACAKCSRRAEREG
jgi:DnaK suppressor protein